MFKNFSQISSSALRIGFVIGYSVLINNPASAITVMLDDKFETDSRFVEKSRYITLYVRDVSSDTYNVSEARDLIRFGKLNSTLECAENEDYKGLKFDVVQTSTAQIKKENPAATKEWNLETVKYMQWCVTVGAKKTGEKLKEYKTIWASVDPKLPEGVHDLSSWIARSDLTLNVSSLSDL